MATTAAQLKRKATIKELLKRAHIQGWAIKKGPKAWVRDHKKWLSFVDHTLFWSKDQNCDVITGKYEFLKAPIFIKRISNTELRFEGSDLKDRVFDFLTESACNKWYQRCQKSVNLRIKAGFQFDQKGTVLDSFPCEVYHLDKLKNWLPPQLATISIVSYKDLNQTDVALLFTILSKEGKEIGKKRYLARPRLVPKKINAWVVKANNMDLAFTEAVFAIKLQSEREANLFQESFKNAWGDPNAYQPEGRPSVPNDGSLRGSKSASLISNPVLRIEEGKPSSSGEWTCAMCTYLNPKTATKCDMCASARGAKPPQEKQASKAPEERKEAESRPKSFTEKLAAMGIGGPPPKNGDSGVEGRPAGSGNRMLAVPEDEQYQPSDEDSLEELYGGSGDKETQGGPHRSGSSSIRPLMPLNEKPPRPMKDLRRLSAYSGTDEEGAEGLADIHYSSDEDQDEIMFSPEFQRKIIASTLRALMAKTKGTSLRPGEQLIKLVRNLKLKDSRSRTLVTSSRRSPFKSLFMHKEAIDCLEALGFASLSPMVYSWDDDFSALTPEQILQVLRQVASGGQIVDLGSGKDLNFMSIGLPTGKAKLDTQDSVASVRSFKSTVATEELEAIEAHFNSGKPSFNTE